MAYNPKPKTCNLALKPLENLGDLALPSYETEQSAGMDLRAAIDDPVTLQPGERGLIKCGFAMALPEGFEAQVRPRSGLALKKGVTVLNGPGTIDADYRGEVCVILINHGQEPFEVERGMRIAQMVISEAPQASISRVEILPETLRGEGGFGSTGTAG